MNFSEKTIVTILVILFIIAAGLLFIVDRLSTLTYQAVLGNSTHTGPADIYPNSQTLGATNPQITQSNINKTICNPKWSTKSIRPPVSYTNNLKGYQLGVNQFQETGYGFSSTTIFGGYDSSDKNLSDYEEDHFISLELGGSPTDPENLWPEPYNASIPDGGAKTKDQVENFLHKEVCSGKLTLLNAQVLIVNDWYQVYKDIQSNSSLGSINDPFYIDPDDQ